MLVTRRRWLSTVLAATAAALTRLGRAHAERPPLLRTPPPVKKTRWIGHY